MESLYAGLAAMFIVFSIFLIGIYVFMVITLWKLFEKGNKPGWASLIPIYNTYVLCEMVGVSPWWILIVFGVSLVGGFIPIIGSLVTLAASIYFSILLNVSLARAFGKEDSFAVGLILLGIVFYPMLAFSKDEYKGVNPMEDFIFKNNKNANTANTNNQNVSNTDTNNEEKTSESAPVDAVESNTNEDAKNDTEVLDDNSSESKYCPNCGTELNKEAKFCTNCGTQIN